MRQDSPARSTGELANGPFRPLLAGQVAQVRMVSRDGSEDRLLLELPRLLEAPNWTPDGACLIVNGGGGLFRLWLDRSEGVEPIPIAGIADANNDHVLSPDGRTLYLTAAGRVHAAAIEGGQPRAISPAGDTAFYLHGVSPDGTTLACTTIGPAPSGGGRRWGIALLPATGGDARYLIEGDTPVDGPEWTPDGAWLWFNGERDADRPGGASLFRLRLADGRIEQMTFGARVDWFPHPDPGGEIVAYLSYPEATEGHPANLPVELRTMPIGGGPHATIAALFGGQGSMNVNSWSPDGRWLAYVAYPVG